MSARLKNIIPLIICLTAFQYSEGQILKFNGQAAGWITVNNSDGTNLQGGIRYIPKLSLNLPVNKKYTLEGELSGDGYLTYSKLPDSTGILDADANFYRFWLRFSGERFEIRAGLQKINFGSASMLRPLMWFDRIDPRDPLGLTKAVYGILGKYYFNNNANIWLWTLYGNKATKGWEAVPSKAHRPEIGGRVQLPVPKGELAFTYHNREGEFPDAWQPPVTGSRFFQENRLGFDFKLDLGVGLWFESSVTYQKQNEIPPFSSAATIGADYTIGIGDGLNITAEQMFINSSEKLLSGGNDLTFTGISLTMPLSIITRVSTICFYDWKNNGLYRFANLSFTFDNLGINLIGFWNPSDFRIFNYGTGPNMFAGYGGQVMIVYNY
ncbi:MAG: hypothetical protein NT092_04430 [Bacteroidia bacterium]|nr:hypothetical protein [Bacteroidia bacterium]